jgi:hypothetical protein
MPGSRYYLLMFQAGAAMRANPRPAKSKSNFATTALSFIGANVLEKSLIALVICPWARPTAS